MVVKLEDLEVYRMAEELADKVWSICVGWDYFARDTVGRQFVKATDSISANLAEGHGRFHYSDRLNFCYYARGSLQETKSWFSKSVRRGLISKQENEIRKIIQILPKKLNAYITSIKRAKASIQPLSPP